LEIRCLRGFRPLGTARTGAVFAETLNRSVTQYCQVGIVGTPQQRRERDAEHDLGSGGPLLLPDQPGPFPHVLLAAGKEGTVYVLDRDTSLGGFTSAPVGWSLCDANNNPTPCTNSAVVKKTYWMVLGQNPTCTLDRDALFGGPAYFAPDAQTNVNTYPRIYYCGQDDFVKAFYFDNTIGELFGPFQQSSATIPDGAIPVISSNGGQNGILWVASRGGTNQSRKLFAYDINPPVSIAADKHLCLKHLGNVDCFRACL
jgi:hypothetical protein